MASMWARSSRGERVGIGVARGGWEARSKGLVMTWYYIGRALQLIGLVITAEALLVHFGNMGPMLRIALLGIGVFYLGRFIQGKRA